VAAWHRAQFTIPVLGITGSNGKTIVKEWLAQLLSPDEMVVKSPRSYNSQIGVPLSVWQLDEPPYLRHFRGRYIAARRDGKAGAHHKPTLGLFTNIGSAHDEGFTDHQQKVEEKLQLFKGKVAVLLSGPRPWCTRRCRRTVYLLLPGRAGRPQTCKIRTQHCIRS
jgi:Alr-MurF fusion protein